MAAPLRPPPGRPRRGRPGRPLRPDRFAESGRSSSPGTAAACRASARPATTQSSRRATRRRPVAAPSRGRCPPAWRRAIARRLDGDRRVRLPLDLRGHSAFEQDVWRKALDIPRGEVRPYGWVAAEIGRPRAVRAVGTALGHNPVPLIVRAIASSAPTGRSASTRSAGRKQADDPAPRGPRPGGHGGRRRAAANRSSAAHRRRSCAADVPDGPALLERNRRPFRSLAEAGARATGRARSAGRSGAALAA